MRAQIAQAARRMHRVTQGRRIPDEELHLTLAFIGAVSEERLEHLLKPPSEIFPPAFLLTLDDWGLWTRKGIGWTGPSVVPASLRRLAEKLDSWLRAEGFDLERRTFAAHVTLVRHARPVALPTFGTSIHWHVGDIALMNSAVTADSARYTVLGKYSLL